MANERQQSGKLHATLNEMKRMIEEERGAAELMTRQLANHRDQKFAFSANRPNFVEVELAEAKKQIAEQKTTTEKWIQQITAERDAGRARLREAEESVLRLQEEIQVTRSHHLRDREAAEGLIQQMYTETQAHAGTESPSYAEAMKQMDAELLAIREQLQLQEQVAEEKILELAAERDDYLQKAEAAAARATETADRLNEAQVVIDAVGAERDAAQAQYAEVEARTQSLEQDFTTAYEQFREQRETALEVIRKLEAESEGSQDRMMELEAQSQELATKLIAAKSQLSKHIRQADDTKEIRIAMLDAVMDMQTKGQKVLDLMQAWSAKASPAGDAAETSELISDAVSA
ncbi:MAG: hypothetical protein EXQ56_14370 [Acidobacteria bacterium]|nr:hypothetical protein [Acidobacteriota bacterium]